MFVKFVLLSFCLSVINAKALLPKDSHHEIFGQKEKYEEFPAVLKNMIHEVENNLEEEEKNSKVGVDLQVESEQEEIVNNEELEEEFKNYYDEANPISKMSNEISNILSSEMLKYLSAQFNSLLDNLRTPTINKHANTIANLVDWNKLAQNFLPALEKFLKDKNFENFVENLGDSLLKQKIDVLESNVNAENESSQIYKQTPDVYVDLDQPAVREFISQTIPKDFGNFPFINKLQGFMNMWKNKIDQDSVPIQKEPY